MPDRFETLVRWYLRFNGYFTVDSFVVTNPNPRPKQSQQTEADVLGLRMPHSREVFGAHPLELCPCLVNNIEYKADVVIAEVKSGRKKEKCDPNSVWLSDDKIEAIEYILRFVGIHSEETEIKDVAKRLRAAKSYCDENKACRYRYIMFTREPDDEWKEKEHVKYITFRSVIGFLVKVRGSSVVEAGLGIRTLHHQWDPFIKDVFAIANAGWLDDEQKCKTIEALLCSR